MKSYNVNVTDCFRCFQKDILNSINYIREIIIRKNTPRSYIYIIPPNQYCLTSNNCWGWEKFPRLVQQNASS